MSYVPYQSRSRGYTRAGSVLLMAFFAVAFLAFTFSLISALISEASTGCKVMDKTQGKGYKGHIQMRVITEGCNGSPEKKVFAVEHQWLAGKFDPTATYNQIEVGKTYDFETLGVTAPLIQSFENIVVITAK